MRVVDYCERRANGVECSPARSTRIAKLPMEHYGICSTHRICLIPISLPRLPCLTVPQMQPLGSDIGP